MADEPDDQDETQDDLPGEVDVPESGESQAYSPTRFETRSCLFRYRQHYIKKTPGISNAVLGYGAFVHRCMEIYVGKCVAAGLPGDALFAEQSVAEAWVKHSSIPPEQYDETVDLMHRVAGREDLPHDFVVGTELSLAVNKEWQPCGWNDPLARFRGRVDMLAVQEAEADVTDFKSHRQAMTAKAVGKSYGARLYPLLALAHNASLRKVRVMFDFVRSGVRRAITYELSDLTRIRDELEQEAERTDALLINKDDPAAWPATPGPQCSVCSYQEVCPKREEVKSAGIVTTQHEAEREAGEILYLEAVLSRKKKNVSSWVSVARPVRVGEIVFDHWPTSKVEWNSKEFLEVARKHGIPLDAVVKPDGAAVKKIGKLNTAFADDAAKTATDVGQTRFGHKKVD